MREERSLDVRKCPRDRCRWGEYLLVGSRLGIEPRQETNEEGKEKVLPHPMPVCLSQCWQTLGGPVDLTASLSSQMEVAEVVQGVEDELPLRGISAVLVLIP